MRLEGPADKPQKMALEDNRHRFQYHFMCFRSPLSIGCKWLVKGCSLDLLQPEVLFIYRNYKEKVMASTFYSMRKFIVQDETNMKITPSTNRSRE